MVWESLLHKAAISSQDRHLMDRSILARVEGVPPSGTLILIGDK
ncbi:MAG TPA: hypothetical protein VH170_02995 [Chthoniobacterales bacterium]|jgi:hypothetical protein|nr:hypothetical protein [Chthoniobacterales bacterium]